MWKMRRPPPHELLKRIQGGRGTIGGFEAKYSFPHVVYGCRLLKENSFTILFWGLFFLHWLVLFQKSRFEKALRLINKCFR